jgi:hypothetical protein
MLQEKDDEIMSLKTLIDQEIGRYEEELRKASIEIANL